jgi:hypothetical protein
VTAEELSQPDGRLIDAKPVAGGRRRQQQDTNRMHGIPPLPELGLGFAQANVRNLVEEITHHR